MNMAHLYIYIYIYMIYDIYDALSFLEGNHNNGDAEQVQMISNDHCFRRILPNSSKFYLFRDAIYRDRSHKNWQTMGIIASQNDDMIRYNQK